MQLLLQFALATAEHHDLLRPFGRGRRVPISHRFGPAPAVDATPLRA
jgi:hypothetical protein